MGQGAIKRSPETLWTAALEQLRRDQNFTRVGELLHVDRKTLRRWWREGLPGAPFGARPMQELAEELNTRDKVAAERRAVATVTETATRLPPGEQAGVRMFAQRAMEEERQILEQCRANAKALLGITSRLQIGALSLARRVSNQLEKPDDPKNPMPLGAAALMLMRTSNMVARSLHAAEMVIDLQRQVAGDPRDAGAEGTAADADAMSLTEALEELRRSDDVLTRAERAGFTLIQGGAVGVETRPAAPQTAGAPGETGAPLAETPPRVNGTHPTANGDDHGQPPDDDHDDPER